MLIEQSAELRPRNSAPSTSSKEVHPRHQMANRPKLARAKRVQTERGMRLKYTTSKEGPESSDLRHHTYGAWARRTPNVPV